MKQLSFAPGDAGSFWVPTREAPTLSRKIIINILDKAIASNKILRAFVMLEDMGMMQHQPGLWSGHRTLRRSCPRWGSPALCSLAVLQSLAHGTVSSVTDRSQVWDGDLALKAPLSSVP